ncbi:MAG TPA: preprotein translocase subunit SecG [Opitutaceae bacterium]|jgi:preprotein translocase subunit SecG
MSILLDILTAVLLLTSLILILLVLMQKAQTDGGMGAAMGGGMAEATFGAETSSVLSKGTINASIIFFVLSFALYLGRIYETKHVASAGGALPSIAVPMSPTKAPAGLGVPAPAPARTAPAAPAGKP